MLHGPAAEPVAPAAEPPRRILPPGPRGRDSAACPSNWACWSKAEKYQIEVRRERAEVAGNQLGRSYLRLNVADFTRLLLGPARLGRGPGRRSGCEASTGLAREAGRALFPPLPLWRPPLDDLTAAS